MRSHHFSAAAFSLPRCEGRIVTGCTYLSAKWPETAAPGEVVIRASTGRYGDERSSSMSDEELVPAVLDELAPLIGTTSPPLDSLVQRWPRAFPQYLPGHLGKIAKAQAALRELPPIEIAGPCLGGSGSPPVLQVASGPRWRFSIASAHDPPAPPRPCSRPPRRRRPRSPFPAALRALAPRLCGSRCSCLRGSWAAFGETRPGRTADRRRTVRHRPFLGGQVHPCRLLGPRRAPFRHVRSRLRARPGRASEGAGPRRGTDVGGMDPRPVALRRRATRWHSSRAGQWSLGGNRADRGHRLVGGGDLSRWGRSRRSCGEVASPQAFHPRRR